jgi:putative heme iron utilization protein
MPIGKIPSLKEWRSFLRKSKSVERKNPIMEAYKYLEFLEQNPGLTYKNVADEFDTTKARVCQMIAVVKKLPQEITNCFMSNNESLDLTYFTERKLRPLTLMESDQVKIEMFNEIRESIPGFENNK